MTTALTPVSNSLDIFIKGDGAQVKGLQGALDDVVATRELLTAASTVIGAAKSIKSAADTIEFLADGLGDALFLVSKVGSVFGGFLGSILQTAASAIKRGLDFVEEAADTVSDTMGGILKVASKVGAVIDVALSAIENEIEPRLQGYIDDSLTLKSSVDRLDTALDSLATAKPFIDPENSVGEVEFVVPARLQVALGQIEDFGQRFAEGNDNNARAKLLADAEEIEGLSIFAAIADGRDALGGADGLITLISDGADLIDNVVDRIDFLKPPVDFFAKIARPLEPLLDAIGFIFDTFVSPIIKPIITALGLDKLLEGVTNFFLGLLPNVDGIDGFVDTVETLGGKIAETLLKKDEDGRIALDKIFDTEDAVERDQKLTEFLEKKGLEAGAGLAGEQLLDFAVNQGVGLAIDLFIGEQVEQALAPVQRSAISHTDASGTVHEGEIVFADALNSNLVTGDGDDILVDDDTANTLSGGAGSDVFMMAEGEDDVDGGAGEDFAVFTNLVSEYRFTVNAENKITLYHLNPVTVGDYSGVNRFTDVENFFFEDLGLTAKAIELIEQLEDGESFDAADVSDAQADGTPTDVEAGANVDLVFGSEGANTIRTGSGNDFIVTGGGADIVRAGFGNDVVAIRGDETRVDGGAGKDVLSAVGNQDGLTITLTIEDGISRAAYGDGTAEIVNFEDVIGGAGGDSITGSEGDNSLLGEAGRDTIDGGDGDDTVNGGAGDDDLTGGTGVDILIGGAGDDTIFGLDEGDEINGGAGEDLLDITDRTDAQEIDLAGEGLGTIITNVEGLRTGSGNDTITAADELNLLQTGAGGDRVILLGGDEDGIDVETGEGGDFVTATLDNVARINLGSSVGVLELTAAAGTVRNASITAEDGSGDGIFNTGLVPEDEHVAVNLTGKDGSLIGTATDATGYRADLEISGFSQFVLSDLDDRVQGEMDVREVDGNGGDDVIDLSQNTIRDPGAFTVSGPTFATLLDGGQGDDSLKISAAGATLVLGGDGNDTLDATGQSAQSDPTGDRDLVDRLRGGDGDDLFRLGAAGDVEIDGGEGSDTMDFAASVSGVTVDLAAGGAIDDRETFSVSPTGETFGVENVTGSDHNDGIIGTGAGNLLSGAAGSDTLLGQGGDDTLEGGTGDDTLRGGEGKDLLSGGTGSDLLTGGAGDDTLSVSIDIDALRGALDTLDGGEGTGDLASFDTPGSVTGISANLASGTVVTRGLQGQVAELRGIENIAGTAKDDEIAGDETANLLYGADGDDLVLGQDGDDQLIGGGGDDTLEGGAGKDVLAGGRGTNRLVGGAGEDRFVLDAGVNMVFGGEDQDTLDIFRVEVESLDAEGAPVTLTTDVAFFRDGDTLTVVHSLEGPGAETVELGRATLQADTEQVRVFEPPLETEGDVSPDAISETIAVADLLDGTDPRAQDSSALPPLPVTEPEAPTESPDLPEFEPEILHRPDEFVLDNVLAVEPIALPGGGFLLIGDVFRGGSSQENLVAQRLDDQGQPVGDPFELDIPRVLIQDILPLEGDLVAIATSNVAGRGVETFLLDLSGDEVALSPLFQGEYVDARAEGNGSLSFRDPSLSGSSLDDLKLHVTQGINITSQDPNRDVDIIEFSNLSDGVFLDQEVVDTLSNFNRGARMETVLLDGGERVIVTSSRGGNDRVNTYQFTIEDAEGETVANVDLPLGDFGGVLGRVDDVVALSNGNFVVTATQEFNPRDASAQQVSFFRIFTPEGEDVSGRTVVETFIQVGDVVPTEDGGFFVHRESARNGVGTSVQRFDAQGDTVGDPVETDPSLTLGQSHLIELANGTLAAVHEGRGDGGGDVVRPVILSDVQNVFRGDAADNVLTGSDVADRIDGRDGADTILSGDGDDNLFGEAGDDQIDAGAGNDTIDGGDGDDLVFGGDGADVIIKAETVFAGAGDDDVRVDLLESGRFVDGGAGADSLGGSMGADTILGQSGDDTLIGGAEADLLKGGAGDDLLDARQNIFGRGVPADDRDTLDGGTGNDTLRGGVGADTYVFATGEVALDEGSIVALDQENGFGHDLIRDFDLDEDVIDLRLVTEVADFLDLAITDVEGAAQITIGENSITLNGVQTAELTRDHFLFDAPQLLGTEVTASYRNLNFVPSSTTRLDFDVTPDVQEVISEIQEDTNLSFFEGGQRDRFVALYEGEFTVEEEGLHTFFLRSDDGSRLFINGELVIRNDGRHAARERSGQIELEEGVNTIELRYFEAGGRAVLELDVAKPGGVREQMDLSPDNLIEGTEASEVLLGRAGDDTLDGGGGDDTLDGGDGTDTAVLAGVIDDYVLTETQTPQGPGLILSGQEQTHTLVDIEFLQFEGDPGNPITLAFAPADNLRVIGSDTSGIVFGSEADDIIFARGGDDTVQGGAGDDRLLGGSGDDVLVGGSGDDTLAGFGGDDTLTGGEGADVFALVKAGPGVDTIEDFSEGDILAIDDTYFGPFGSPEVDLRQATVQQLKLGVELGVLGYDRSSGEVSIQGEVVADLGAGTRIGLDDVFLF